MTTTPDPVTDYERDLLLNSVRMQRAQPRLPADYRDATTAHRALGYALAGVSSDLAYLLRELATVDPERAREIAAELTDDARDIGGVSERDHERLTALGVDVEAKVAEWRSGDTAKAIDRG